MRRAVTDRDISTPSSLSPQPNNFSPRRSHRESSKRYHADLNLEDPPNIVASSEVSHSLTDSLEIFAPSTSSVGQWEVGPIQTGHNETFVGNKSFDLVNTAFVKNRSNRHELRIGVRESLMLSEEDISNRRNAPKILQDFSSPNMDRTQSQDKPLQGVRMYNHPTGRDRVGRSPKEDEHILRRSSDSQMHAPIVSLPVSSKKRSSGSQKRSASLESESNDSAGSDSNLELTSLREIHSSRSADWQFMHRNETDCLKFYEEMHFENADLTSSQFSLSSWEPVHSHGENIVASCSQHVQSDSDKVEQSISENKEEKVKVEISAVLLKPLKSARDKPNSNETNYLIAPGGMSSLKSTKLLKRSETFDHIPLLKNPFNQDEEFPREDSEAQEELLEPKDRFRKTLDKFKSNIGTKDLKPRAPEASVKLSINSTSSDSVGMRCLTTPQKLRPMSSNNLEISHASNSANVRSNSAFARRTSDLNSAAVTSAVKSVDEWEINPEAPLSVKFKETQKKFEVLIKRNSNLPFSKDHTPSDRSIRAHRRMNASADQIVAFTDPATRLFRRHEVKSFDAGMAPDSPLNQLNSSQIGDRKTDKTNSAPTELIEPSTSLERDIQKSNVTHSLSVPIDFNNNNNKQRRPSNRQAMEMIEKFNDRRQDAAIRPDHFAPSLDSISFELVESNTHASSIEVSPPISPLTRSLSRSPSSVGKINLSLKERAKAALNLKLLQMSRKLVSQIKSEDGDSMEDGPSISSSADSSVVGPVFDGKKNPKVSHTRSWSEISLNSHVSNKSRDISASHTSTSLSKENHRESQVRTARHGSASTPTRASLLRKDVARVRNAASPMSSRVQRAPTASSRNTPSKKWSNGPSQI